MRQPREIQALAAKAPGGERVEAPVRNLVEWPHMS